MSRFRKRFFFTVVLLLIESAKKRWQLKSAIKTTVKCQPREPKNSLTASYIIQGRTKTKKLFGCQTAHGGREVCRRLP